MTAVDGPARSGPAERPVLVPFPVVDEVARHCLQEEEPETIHIEIRLPGRPDPERLRRAFTGALRRHPRAQVRQMPGPWYRRRYYWGLTGEPDPGVDVVTVPAPEPEALERARERCLASAPPLSASPPVRLELVADSERPGGTALFLTVNHTALDGLACLRILATAAELYGGRGNAPAAPPVRASPGDRAGVAPGPSPWVPPARVARGTPSGRPGNGMLVADLAVPRRPPGAAYTVNDQLLVATALTIAHWNQEHGAPPRPIRITMPVDDRPRGADMPIGNGTRLVEVPFTVAELASGERGAADRDLDALDELLRRTADRTRALKAATRPQLGYGMTLLTAPVVPVAWRAALTRGLRRAAGPWTSTALLSNIGRIPYTLDFGDAGRADAVWVSAPARMPRGLSVTTASTAGRLQLSLRWSTTLLARSDGARLLELFEQFLHMTEVATSGNGRAKEGGPA
ncbi:condensation protein [Streptomyces qinzhouensis]|uniref:Condensation protein n=1 Tax=Streptomyces qinzhouensis TaxID=2599401 RepID=A0A5B8JQA2_9ACTN|nr:condensation protein [Streptomyces qinzhouensis]QDY80060.1 condensation protein [Streptomyces qinzhouensis]